MTRRGWLYFVLMSLIWGVPYLLIKVAVGGVSAPVLVFARTAIGALILLPLAFRGDGLAAVRRHWLPVLAFAGIEIMLPWLLLTDAEHHVSSSLAGLLIAASPTAAVVVGRLSGDREPLGPARWTGLAAGFAGVLVLAAPELRGGQPWAIVELLLTAVCYATAPLIVARRLADVPALPMTAACLALAAVLYAPAAVLTWPDRMPAAKVLAALVGLGLVCTALAFLVFFALIRQIGPARATVITYVNPAVAVTAGVLLLGEDLTVPMLAAFALILGGSVLATARRRPVPQEVAATYTQARTPDPSDTSTR